MSPRSTGPVDIPLADVEDAAPADAASDVRSSFGYDVANTEWGKRVRADVDRALKLGVIGERWRKRLIAGAIGMASLSTGLLAYVVRRIDTAGYERRVGEEYRRQVDRNTDSLQQLRDAIAELRGQFSAVFPGTLRRDKDLP